jgi:hypothetical protein
MGARRPVAGLRPKREIAFSTPKPRNETISCKIAAAGIGISHHLQNNPLCAGL